MVVTQRKDEISVEVDQEHDECEGRRGLQLNLINSNLSFGSVGRTGI